MPFPAGGGGDVLTRMVAEQWAQAHGVTDRDREPPRRRDHARHRSGLARRAGRQHARHRRQFLHHPPNFKKLSYDPLTSFEPVCLLGQFAAGHRGQRSSPYKTLTEWLDAARAKPGELSHASVGPASPQHIAFEQLKLLAKVNITFVPFNGNTPALNALLGGHVGSVMSNYSEAAELVASGKLRALAVASARRVDGLADVPTVAEQGFKDYSVEAWYGLVAPAKTPKDMVAELDNGAPTAMLAPELKPKWELQGLAPVGSTSEEFAAHLRKQSEDYARVIREANIKGE